MQEAFGSSVLTHKKEQQIKIEGEFKPTVDCLCATRRGLVAVYIKKNEECRMYMNDGNKVSVEAK